MGLRLTLLRNAAPCARVPKLERSAATTAVAGRRAALAPPLAVRPGVDPASLHAAAAAGQEAAEPADARRQKQQKRERRAPPPRPTHFLALQVSQHPAAVAAICQVQEGLRRHSPHLSEACVEAASAHLTLGVMALHGAYERQRAAEVLAGLGPLLAEQRLLAAVEVQLEGLSTFNDQVLYLDLRQDGGLQQLMQLAAASRAHFQAAGLLLQAEQQFVPHLTVAKMSKLQRGGSDGGWGGSNRRSGSRGRHGWRQERRSKQQQVDQQQLEGDDEQRGQQQHEGEPQAEQRPPQQQQQQQLERRGIPPESWAPHAAIAGGPALLTELQLCSMQGRKPGAYYQVLCSLALQNPPPDSTGGEEAGQHQQEQQGQEQQQQQAASSLGEPLVAVSAADQHATSTLFQ